MLKEDLFERSKEEGLPLKILEKEALQIYILSELFSLPESNLFTFQGGTCLRLIYGGVRYSEDLDFVTIAKEEEIERVFSGLSAPLRAIAPFFGGRLEIIKQKTSKTFYRFKAHNRRDNPHESFFVSLEFACYPAYTLNIAALHPQKELPGLPLTVVRAEKLEEILADKLCAVAGRPFSKGRDLFDLWLLKQKGIVFDPLLLKKKMKDYSVPTENLKRGLSIASAENLRAEMERFLPLKYRRQFESDHYEGVLSAACAVIREGIKAL